jgi:hypothetical protein
MSGKRRVSEKRKLNRWPSASTTHQAARRSACRSAVSNVLIALTIGKPSLRDNTRRSEWSVGSNFNTNGDTPHVSSEQPGNDSNGTSGFSSSSRNGPDLNHRYH